MSDRRRFDELPTAVPVVALALFGVAMLAAPSQLPRLLRWLDDNLTDLGD